MKEQSYSLKHIYVNIYVRENPSSGNKKVEFLKLYLFPLRKLHPVIYFLFKVDPVVLFNIWFTSFIFTNESDDMM